MVLVIVGCDVTTVDLGEMISFSRLDIFEKLTIASTSPSRTSAFAPVVVMGISSTYVATCTVGWDCTNGVTELRSSARVSATENLHPAMIDC